jgi:uncharacterized cupin superfamily protein
MPKIDIASIKPETGSGYPDPYHIAVAGRVRKRLGNAAGLDQFGVNLMRLPSGTQSSQRHWHQSEDEFVYVLDGELVLLENDGETVLKAGDAAGWKAGTDNGHCLINRSQRDALYLEIGTRKVHDRVDYPDIDMLNIKDEKGARFTHRSGEPYPPRT